MSVPSQWWLEAEPKLINPADTRERFYEILNRHPEPKKLIDYLNPRRFVLLLSIIEQCECLFRFLLRHPREFERTIPNLWYLTKTKEDYLEELAELLEDVRDEGELAEKLAYFKHREFLRILAKDILKTSGLQEILREYSYLADALIEKAFEFAFRYLSSKYGVPVDEAGREVSYAVIGLGKLGSEELNYYSDVDLLLLYSEDKASAGSLTAHQFYERVFKKGIELLSKQTSEGTAFLVDLDLRPFGKSGPIGVSLRSAELYYESYGRLWERFALLRARPVAGNLALGKRFMVDVVKPFVYRYADYRVIEEIKMMKQKIEAEGKKRILKGYNVKTGEGGIREVEFTVHALTILLGARSRFIRERSTFKGIWKLYQKGVFSEEEAEFLERAYEFLRNLEHRIQIRKCIQTQLLREEDHPHVAKALGFEDVKSFANRLEEVRRGVRNIFDSLIPERRKEEFDSLQIALITNDEDLGVHALSQAGVREPGRVFELLRCYISGKEGIKLSETQKDRFIHLVPKIESLIKEDPSPFETMKNFEKFFVNPTGKRVVLSDGREDFLPDLFNVFRSSDTLSSLISRNPDLVEDVLTLYRDFPSPDKLREEFDKYRETLGFSFDNLLRRFKNVWEIRLGLLYLMGDRSYENFLRFITSLSELADFLLERAWIELGLDEEALLLALGKLGSRELTIKSDLDLVFAFGRKSEPINRKVRDFVRLITAHTGEGYLYDVDFRLRPMGSKGELLPVLDFYERYFRTDARVWERLAWTRARFICGSEEVWRKLMSFVEELLFARGWDEGDVEEIRKMRRLLEENSKQGKGSVDIKAGRGGIFDGDFLVQFLIVQEGLRETSMLRAFEDIASKHPDLAEPFRAYAFLRQVETHLRLVREVSGSVLRKQDVDRVALSMGMKGGEFMERLRYSMDTLRKAFNDWVRV